MLVTLTPVVRSFELLKIIVNILTIEEVQISLSIAWDIGFYDSEQSCCWSMATSTVVTGNGRWLVLFQVLFIYYYDVLVKPYPDPRKYFRGLWKCFIQLQSCVLFDYTSSIVLEVISLQVQWKSVVWFNLLRVCLYWYLVYITYKDDLCFCHQRIYIFTPHLL